MRATFFGYEIVKTGIQSAQTALDVTGQNIAKMNAEGYSRQTVLQSAVNYSSVSYKYAPQSGGVLPQGVTIDQIMQIKDSFLDIRFRAANSENHALVKTNDILQSIENIFDETVNKGLGFVFDEFYHRLQTLSLHTGDIGDAGLVRSSAQKITESLGYYYKQLESIKSREEGELNAAVSDMNTILEKITVLNATIRAETLQNSPTNDLLDQLNLCLDDLSAYMNITTKINDDGTTDILVGSAYLIDSKNAYTAFISREKSDGELVLVTENGKLDVDAGILSGFLNLLNGKGAFAAESETNCKGIPYYQEALDTFAARLKDVFNELNGHEKPLFAGETALTLTVTDQWLKDANYITATLDPENSDGQNDNIIRMLAALDSPLQLTGAFTGTFDEYITSLSWDIAADVSYYNDLGFAARAVLSSVDNQRESVRGVSLNEETVNLLKYQKAFEASARVMTALDEMLDVIINKMGMVGR